MRPAGLRYGCKLQRLELLAQYFDTIRVTRSRPANELYAHEPEFRNRLKSMLKFCFGPRDRGVPDLASEHFARAQETACRKESWGTARTGFLQELTP